MTHMTITPKLIKDTRLMMNMSQEAFAEYIGASVVSVNRWENGKTKIQDPEVRQDILSLANTYLLHLPENEEDGS